MLFRSDVTESVKLFGDPVRLADTIRQRIKDEVGITASIGVSFNKVFAKLGSDYKKPDATTVITPQNMEQIVYPLPIEDLLYVGRATTQKMHLLGFFFVTAMSFGLAVLVIKLRSHKKLGKLVSYLY